MMLGILHKGTKSNSRSLNEELEFGLTLSIIFNLAHIGFSIDDSKYADIAIYLELAHLEMKVIDGKQGNRK